MTPRLRAPGAEDAGFLFRLAAECDLRWPAVSRFNQVMTPASVLNVLQSVVEVGYLVLDSDRSPVGVVGLVDADVPSRVVWLDGHSLPGDQKGLQLISEAVPIVLDEVGRAGTVRFVYYDDLVELNESIIDGENFQFWEEELRIPQFVQINGLWCSRVTYRLDVARWVDR